MTVLSWLNGYAGWWFILGAGVVILLNIRRWQQDRIVAQRLRQQPTDPPTLGATPMVSVLVAAWNEIDAIGQHIESFRRLRYPHKELVLCAGGSDGTYQAARACAREGVTILEQQPGEGKQAALRRCFAQAKGEIIFLTDADCLLSDNVFEHTLAPLINENASAATGRFEPLPHQTPNPFVLHYWFIDLYSGSRWSNYTEGLVGANAAVRREALEAAGGFSSDVRIGTDYHLAKSLRSHDYRIRYVHESSVPTAYAESLKYHWKRQTRWMRNVVTHGIAFGVRGEVVQALTPSLLGTGVLLGTLAGLVLGRFVLASAGLLWLYVLGSRARYMRFGELVTQTSFGWGYVRLPLYIALDFVIWSLTLVQYPIRQWRSRW